RTSMKRSPGRQRSRRHAEAARAASKFARLPTFLRGRRCNGDRPMPQLAEVSASVEAVFRREHGRIIASLIRLCGSFDRAEEAMQEAFAAALRHWAERGIPDNPAAWITTTAYRKLIDAKRRERTRREKQTLLEQEIAIEATENPALPEALSREIPDDRLRLIYTCCHPALNREAQIALTLRTLGGLSTGEIARAF